MKIAISSRPGTREYYAQRDPYESQDSRAKILRELIEMKIRRSVALQMPISDRPSEEELGDTQQLIGNDNFISAYLARDTGNQMEVILNNCKDRRGEQLAGSLVDNTVILFLEEISAAIPDYTFLPDIDQGTQELCRECAQMFIDKLINQIHQRVVPFGDQDASPFLDPDDYEDSPEERYEVLDKLSQLSGPVRESAIQQICDILPYTYTSTMDFHSLKEILEKSNNPR